MSETTTIDLSIETIVQHNLTTVSPDDAIVEAAKKLIAHDVSALPVVGPDGALVGIVSEYDVIGKRGRSVGEVMSRGVVAVAASASAAEAARLMALHGIRLLPVLQNGRLVGTVARSDLVRLFSAVAWTCQSCGAIEHGLSQPETCLTCSGAEFAATYGFAEPAAT
jgi:CBS domain-containing protein